MKQEVVYKVPVFRYDDILLCNGEVFDFRVWSSVAQGQLACVESLDTHLTQMVRQA